MKSVHWVNAQRFDPEARDGERWTELAALLADVLDMNASKPLSVPIDPAAIASQDSPRLPWGMPQERRLTAALSLLGLVENCDFKTLRTIAERLEIIGKNGMPEVNRMAVGWVDALGVAEREDRTVNKSDVATKAGLAGVIVPAGNKRRDWFEKYGMNGIPQHRPAKKPRADR
ncbi:hypothetical protein HQ447_07360 [bacterium]|nr:hypothetical protein [bacterium]